MVFSSFPKKMTPILLESLELFGRNIWVIKTTDKSGRWHVEVSSHLHKASLPSSPNVGCFQAALLAKVSLGTTRCGFFRCPRETGKIPEVSFHGIFDCLDFWGSQISIGFWGRVGWFFVWCNFWYGFSVIWCCLIDFIWCLMMCDDVGCTMWKKNDIWWTPQCILYGGLREVNNIQSYVAGVSLVYLYQLFLSGKILVENGTSHFWCS